MFGINIFLHAIQMVLNNLPVAIRISAVLMGVQFAVVMLFGNAYVAPAVAPGELPGGGSVLAAVISFAIVALTSLMVAVAWHRFILREEVPAGPVPAINGAALVSYIIAGLILGLIVILVAIPVGIVVGLLFAPVAISSGGEPGVVIGFLALTLTYLPIAYVVYRISPILPSAALEARMPLKEAWYATGTSGAAFVVLTVVSVLAGLLLNAPAAILPGILGSVWSFLANWVSILVGASVLTTIYGHYVEGRPLNV